MQVLKPRVLEILTPEECARTARAVDDLRALWIDRGGTLFTLGVGAYLDAPHPWNVERGGKDIDPQRDYVNRSRELNPVLREHFDWLYERILTALSDSLGATAVLCPGKAVPGFHIFYSDPVHESAAAHMAHVDRPYGGIDWSGFDEVDFRRSISFTLPVELPTAGGGLRIWDLDLFDAGEWPPGALEERLRQAESRVHAYAPGRMLLHGGHALHRIEPWPYAEGERRLTLQGHGLYCDGGWKVYF